MREADGKAHLFLIDYMTRERIKLWGIAHAVENDPALIDRLMPTNYKAKSEQAILFTVLTRDAHCPQHIPQLLDAHEVAMVLQNRDQKIAELEAEIRQLHTAHPFFPEV